MRPASRVFILLLILAGLSLFSFSLPQHARALECPLGPWYEQTPCQFYQRVKGPGTPENEIFGERYTYAQINWIFNSLYNMLMPSNIANENDLREYIKLFIPEPGAPGGRAPAIQEYAKFGIPGLLLGGISETLTYRPASGIDEVKSLATKVFDVSTGVQSVYAQGYGFGQLSVVQILWTATRNMAYLVSVILLIGAGFAIMFRIKINPQTVVSLQTMIPKVVISLLLITFSYAIAGLVIDLIYVFIALFLGALSTFNVINPGNLGSAISWFTSSSYTGLVVYYVLPWIILGVLGAVGFFFGAETGIIAAAGGVLIIVAIVFAVFFLWTLFKIWWMLVKTQLTLIFLIIVAPFQIMMGLIPGQAGFGSWLRNVAANASVFVVVPMMFVLNMIFWRPFGGSTEWSGIWASLLEWARLNPLGQVTTGIGGTSALPNLPFVNGGGLIFNFIIGYVILTLIPKVADMVRDALKVPAFKYGAAVGEALAPVSLLYGAAAGPAEAERKFRMDQASRAGTARDLETYRELAGQERWDQRAREVLKRITKS